VRAAATATLARKEVPLALEQGEMPLNTYNNKAPFKARVKSVERIVGPNATGETCNIVIETEGKIPFWEGQSYGVIPPGTKVNSKGKEVPHGVRLYSIASSRYGDAFDGQTTTLCVRRAVYVDPETGKEDPAKKGIWCARAVLLLGLVVLRMSCVLCGAAGCQRLRGWSLQQQQQQRPQHCARAVEAQTYSTARSPPPPKPNQITATQHHTNTAPTSCATPRPAPRS
jgi:hypothetical protein